MDSSTAKISLESLPYFSYLSDEGSIDQALENKIGVYAIFNQTKNLEYVGYSRNLLLSLKQHFVRQPHRCYWLKYYLIDRPSRSTLESIRQSWLAEKDSTASDNDQQENLWNQPIDAKKSLTPSEQQEYQENDELGKIKLLKKVARRVETEIKTSLAERNFTMEIRFNPKLKEQGLLDLK